MIDAVRGGKNGPMQLTHRFSVPADLETAWAAFSRLEQIAPCFPGATVTSVSGRDYGGFVKIKFGPIPLVYNGSAQITELDRRARRMVFKAIGHDRRGNGSATSEVTVTFTETGTITDVLVITELSITGRPAQFGGAVISDVSDRLLDLFVNCISARFRAGDFAADRRAGDAGVGGGAAGGGGAGVRGAGGGSTAAGRGVGPEDQGEVAAAAAFPRTAPYVYKPPSDEAQPHLQVVSTFVPVVLKRSWPVLVGLGLGAVIAARILRRR